MGIDRREQVSDEQAACPKPVVTTANPQTKDLDFGGFDSSRFLMFIWGMIYIFAPSVSAQMFLNSKKYMYIMFEVVPSW